IFWLGLWTVGGVAAIWEFLRLICGKDRIEVTADSVKIDNGYGLFHLRKNLRRDEIRRFYNRPGLGALCADTAHGSVELTRVRVWKARVRLADKLNAFSGVSPKRREANLPSGWCEILSLESENILVRDPAPRRKQAVFAWTICTILSSIAAYVAREANTQPSL